jgi:hypothetical protein
MQRLRFTTLDRFRMILDRQINANVVVLAGAGVSMIPPTVLPSGDSLRDECVRHLLSDGTSRRVIRRLLRTPAYRSLLPEAKAQILQGRLSKAADIGPAGRGGKAYARPLHLQRLDIWVPRGVAGHKAVNSPHPDGSGSGAAGPLVEAFTAQPPCNKARG